MSTQLNQVTSVPYLPEVPLPEFCGPSPDFAPYIWTPKHRRKRAVRARRARYAALAFYRIQAGRAAARGNTVAASWYAERAAMYARLLRPKVAASVGVEKPASLMDELRSWIVMSEVIAAEAHLTAEDYLYA
jgi:hypothetical protein